MTYALFLGLFLGIPICLLAALGLYQQRSRGLLPGLQNLSPWIAWIAHVLVAVGYTTPWDNYLVATRVWWYNPALVTGLLIGWVPIEEYTFFIFQTTLTSLLLFALARGLPGLLQRQALPGADTARVGARIRWIALLIVAPLWLGAVAVLAWRWQPGTYLALLLAWALPPIALQLLFGADLLFQYRRLVGLSILLPTAYLALADSLAIGHGTWTINPSQSINLFIGGVLPFEELVFFLVTNTLIVFGVTLVLACESRSRRQAWLQRLVKSQRVSWLRAAFLSRSPEPGCD